jgi:predicted RNase H-like nuclease (RuvC/YqgF family)
MDTIQSVIASIKSGKALTPAELKMLEDAIKSGQITIATGDRAASIGGNADGAVVITGNGNIVITGTNAEPIRELLAATQQPATSASGKDREQPMSFKRQRLEKQRQTLHSEWETRTDKLQRLRDASAIETSPSIKFQLEHQIKDEENTIAKLEKQLAAIEDSLNRDEKEDRSPQKK